MRLGIRQDYRLLRYHLWHAVMRAAWRGDLWLVRLHTYAFLKASKYSPFKEGRRD